MEQEGVRERARDFRSPVIVSLSFLDCRGTEVVQLGFYCWTAEVRLPLPPCSYLHLIPCDNLYIDAKTRLFVKFTIVWHEETLSNSTHADVKHYAYVSMLENDLAPVACELALVIISYCTTVIIVK